MYKKNSWLLKVIEEAKREVVGWPYWSKQKYIKDAINNVRRKHDDES